MFQYSVTKLTHIPALRVWEQCLVVQLFDLLSPLLFVLCLWVQVGNSIFLCLLDCIEDPVALKLDAGRAVGERRWSVSAIQEEHVGIAVRGHAKIRISAFSPLLLEVLAVDV